MSEQSRKVLEEIQKAKSNLLKQGAAAALGLTFTTPPVVPANNHFNAPPPSPSVGFSEVHLSPAQRSAMQSLQHANTTSFGSFISQESHFGNSILPVLPRFDNMTKPSTSN